MFDEGEDCEPQFAPQYSWVAISGWPCPYETFISLFYVLMIVLGFPALLRSQDRGREEKGKMDCWDSKGEIMKKKEEEEEDVDDPKGRAWREEEAEMTGHHILQKAASHYAIHSFQL